MKHALIFIPFHNPWHWHTDYTNQTARLLSKTHTVVCFLWGDAVSLWELIQRRKSFRPITKSGNLWKIQPLFLIPGKRLLFSQCINIGINAGIANVFASLLAMTLGKPKLFWFFGFYDPVFLLLRPIFRFWRTVYDCVDVPASPNGTIAQHIERSEHALLSYSWLVVANSLVLTEILRKKGVHAYTVPLGFRIEMFRNPKNTNIPRHKKPMILYLGSLDYRIDWPLLESLIRTHASYQFLLYGPIFYDHISPQTRARMDRVFAAPNVLHDHIDPSYLPALIKHCDVAIIPYDLRYKMARFCYPMKVMEYFYGQKPIISTPIVELKRFPDLIRFGTSPAAWSRAMTHALNAPLTPEQKRRMRQIALENTWTKKIDAIEALIDGKRALPE